MRKAPRWMASVGAALFLAGCSTYLGSSRPAGVAELAAPGWIAVKDVPHIAQREDKDCGAAALAMVLVHLKAAEGIDEVRAGCPPDAERGIDVSALRAYAKKKGLMTFLFNGEFGVFEHELARGRPVLVGMGKRTPAGTVSHFEVVVGYHPDHGLVMTQDPALGTRVNDEAAFREEWTSAECLTLVVFRPPND